jgi:hypothetical protein
MRSVFLIVFALCSISAFADSTNVPLATNLLTAASAAAPTNPPAAITATPQTNAPAATVAESLVADGWMSKSQEEAPLTFALRPNEIKVGRLTLDGVAVELAKADTHNPLQLLNPFAPANYGSPEDNVFRSPVDGKVSGLKIFEIRF